MASRGLSRLLSEVYGIDDKEEVKDIRDYIEMYEPDFTVDKFEAYLEKCKQNDIETDNWKTDLGGFEEYAKILKDYNTDIFELYKVAKKHGIVEKFSGIATELSSMSFGAAKFTVSGYEKFIILYEKLEKDFCYLTMSFGTSLEYYKEIIMEEDIESVDEQVFKLYLALKDADEDSNFEYCTVKEIYNKISWQ